MKNIGNSLKERLKSGKTVLGTWCVLPSEAAVNVIAKSGVDFVIIDMEHGAIDYQCAFNMITASRAEGVEALVRVSSSNEPEILKVLDMGSNGVIVPHIETAGQRKEAISFLKFPPHGIRSYSPYVRSSGYSVSKNYTAIQNKQVLSGIIIEGLDAIENISEVIDDPELDLVYIGAYDISAALGIPGDVSNPRVISILKDCVKKIRTKKKAAGALFHSEKEFRFFKSIGVQFLCYRVDTDLLFSAYRNMLNYLRR